MARIPYLATAAAMSLVAFDAQAVTLTASTSASGLAAALLAPGGGINIIGGSETYQGGATQGGTYSGFSLSNSSNTITIGDGVVLTSGSINDIPGNDSSAISASPGAGTDADLQSIASQTVTADANVLKFNFTVDPGVTSVSLDFVFATDEFPNQSVTDIFGVFVDGVNYAFLSDGSLVNFDLGSPAAAFFRNNDFGSADPYVDASGGGFEYDGIISTLKLSGILSDAYFAANGFHTIKVAIGDTSDTIFDSGVFVSGLTGGTDTGGGGVITDPNVVPLPAGLPLLLAGVGALAVVRRRKKS